MTAGGAVPARTTVAPEPASLARTVAPQPASAARAPAARSRAATPATPLPAVRAVRHDALAVMLSRAVADRRRALLQRSPQTAAKAMVGAKIDKFNKGSYESWLAQRSELDGRKGTNAVLHEVGAGDIQKVRSAYEAALAEAKAAVEDAPPEQEKPTKYVATGKKAQAAAKLSAPKKDVVRIPRPAAAEMTWEYGPKHGDLHFGGKPTKNKTKWSIDKEAAIELMEAEIGKHLNRMVSDSTDVENAWTTWYIAYEPDYEVGNYFITPREFGSTNTFSMQVQVSLTDRFISFHGYPDEQVRGRGIGTARNQIG
jgi:hypothetical protein